MKTERRHELQTNELAIWLTGWLEAIKPYSKVLLGALVLLAAAWFAAAYVRNRGRESESRAWTALFQAYTPSAASDVSEQMADVAKSYPGTPAGLWALQTAADVHLAEGTQQLFRDREQAKQDLQQAQEAYDTIAQQATDPMLKQRAMFGAAQALECLGDFDQAEKKYRELSDSAPDSAVGQLASRRLESLKRPTTRDWYRWFAEQKPVARPLSDPSLFNELPKLPETPNINLPKPGELMLPTGEPSTDSGGGAAPAGDLPLIPGTGPSSPADPSLPLNFGAPSDLPADGVMPEATPTTDGTTPDPVVPAIPEGTSAAAPAPVVPETAPAPAGETPAP